MSALKNMPISFPGLFGDWELNIDPVAIHIGHGIYWYGIILAFAMLAGLYLCMKQAKHYGLTEDNVMDMVLWAVPCCIIGSRIYYVLFYLDLYRKADGSLDWGAMLRIWDGGLAIYGTVIVGVLVALIYTKRHKIPFFAMTDLAVMGLMLGQIIGRWANFINREAFGTETTLPWRMKLWVTSYTSIEVLPTFLYESLWYLIGLLLIVFIVSKGRRFDGENTWFYFLWYGLGRSWIEGLRTDSLYLFNWELFGQRIRVSQALSIVMAAVAAFMLVYNIAVKKRSPEGLWVRRKPSRPRPKIGSPRKRRPPMRKTMAVRIDGKALAVKVKARAAAAVAELPRRPGLAVVLVGEDPASQVYVRGKEADCAECGIRSFPYRLPAQTTQAELLTLIDHLNRAPEVDGILVQLPLPEPLEEAAVIEAIAPEKDVDCFHPYNVGRLQAGSPVFLPCTPTGVMEMLREYGISPAGKRCVVLGRSNIVGKPMAALLTQADGTVTLCHSRTPDLAELTRQADILVSAVGRVNFVTADMVKAGAVVIDVAMNRNDAGKLCGDVDFAGVEPIASYITPVPGGVGPMTRAMLMSNIVTAARLHTK